MEELIKKKQNIIIRLILIICAICCAFNIKAQQVIPLYKDAIPNSRPAPNLEYTDANGNIFKNSTPELISFFPPKEIANKTAIIIVPGGGYAALVTNEFDRIVQEFNKLGMACFILKYRLPDIAIMIDPSLGPIEDAQQAIKTVRENAAKWNINPDRIGVLGFSAGGHLAATVGTHFNKNYIENKNNTSLRPDFMVLVYPVISMLDSLAHQDSKHTLLSANPTNAEVLEFSNERQITAQTPPTFLLHASDDDIVPVGNSIEFYRGLVKNKVPASMHIFPTGKHGFSAEPAKSKWLGYCISWLQENGWLNKH